MTSPDGQPHSRPDYSELELLLDTSTDLLYQCTADGQVLYMNATCQHILTPTAPSPLLKTLHPGRAYDSLLAILLPYARQHTHWQGEFEVFFGPGNLRQAHMHIQCHHANTAEERFSVAIQTNAQTQSLEQAIQEIARGVSSDIGDNFLRSLVQTISRVLDMEYVYIGEAHLKPDGYQVQALMTCKRGAIIDNFLYTTLNTPCDELLKGKRCTVPINVARLYPDDAFLFEHNIECYVGTPLHDEHGRCFGVLVAMDSKPLFNAHLAESILAIYAGRAAAEIQRKNTEQKLRLANQVLENSPAILIDWGASKTTKPLYISENINRLGLLPQQLSQGEVLWFDLVLPEDQALFLQAENGPANGRMQFSQKYRLRCPDGRLRWISDYTHCQWDERQQCYTMCSMLLDITQNEMMSERLRFQANCDSLTGLLNRRAFETRLASALAQCKRDGRQHTLCYIDLDQFKVVNDTCGHFAGDELLRQLTRLLQQQLRSHDTLARLGGDEFGLLLEDRTLEQSRELCQRLLKTIRTYRFCWDEFQFAIGASIGLVPITQATDSVSNLFSSADTACYAAKESGRNRIHCFLHNDTELQKRNVEMQWAGKLQRALEENRLQLYFQPIQAINQDGLKLLNFEVLLRLKNPRGEIIPPSAFLPAAERYNLMPLLDRWVTFTALEWLNNHPDTLNKLHKCSINLSGLTLSDTNFLEALTEKLQQTQVPGDKLCFEITETAAISNMQIASTFIQAMRALGCSFALDDFGSGLSSFAYLKNLSVDFLKIDGTFIKDMVNNPIDLAMVKSINEIGHTMGIQTVAEFVEDQDTLHKLEQLGVDFAQGYGIAKPAPFDKLAAYCIDLTQEH